MEIRPTDGHCCKSTHIEIGIAKDKASLPTLTLLSLQALTIENH